MPGGEALGGLVGLTHLQQDIGAAGLLCGADELGEHEGGNPPPACDRDGGDGQQVRAGQAAGVVETGIPQEPWPVQSGPSAGIGSVVGVFGLTTT